MDPDFIPSVLIYTIQLITTETPANRTLYYNVKELPVRAVKGELAEMRGALAHSLSVTLGLPPEPKASVEVLTAVKLGELFDPKRMRGLTILSKPPQLIECVIANSPIAVVGDDEFCLVYGCVMIPEYQVIDPLRPDMCMLIPMTLKSKDPTLLYKVILEMFDKVFFAKPDDAGGFKFPEGVEHLHMRGQHLNFAGGNGGLCAIPGEFYLIEPAKAPAVV